MEKMHRNTGMAGGMFGLAGEDGLERKNPVIVALGDSVTAGHFESTMTPAVAAKLAEGFAMLQSGASAGPWEELLANRINHPSVEGHEVYAKVLMKLFSGEDRR